MRIRIESWNFREEKGGLKAEWYRGFESWTSQDGWLWNDCFLSTMSKRLVKCVMLMREYMQSWVIRELKPCSCEADISYSSLIQAMVLTLYCRSYEFCHFSPKNIYDRTLNLMLLISRWKLVATYEKSTEDTSRKSHHRSSWSDWALLVSPCQQAMSTCQRFALVKIDISQLGSKSSSKNVPKEESASHCAKNMLEVIWMHSVLQRFSKSLLAWRYCQCE